MLVAPRFFTQAIVVVLSCLAGEASVLAGDAAAPPAPAAFSFDTVREAAQASAAQAYRNPVNKTPEYLKKLSYDDFQAIRFIRGAGPWKGENLRFTFEFFHPGFLYQDEVLMHLVENGEVKDYGFDPKLFEYGTNRFPEPLPKTMHFPGFRILFPVNLPTKQDEVASFVGASYFRLLGKGQRYGVSARALAIDTAEPTGEEFPRFTEFWIEKPAPQATSLKFYGLLDSMSAAGAYQFVLTPGNVTVLDVDSYVYMRKDVHKLGLAPLTSMFYVGANRTRCVLDYRPELHDSDGLLLQTASGESEWRPLINPEKTFRLTHFVGDNIKGFGLLQRQRDFGYYQDLGARYDLRPDLWCTPRQAFGAGTLELVEIPTPNEFNDNIVVYWVPADKAAAGRHFHSNYSLSSSLDDPPRSPLMAAHSTRIDPPRDGKPPRFFVDFVGRAPIVLAPDAPVTANISASRGQIQNLIVQPNEVTGGWRVFFDLAAPGNDKVDLRGTLNLGGRVLSETWIYLWLPQ